MKHIRLILKLTTSIGIFSILIFLSACRLAFDFTIGGLKNKAILEELNQDFVLNPNYELLVFTHEDLKMEWLYHKDNRSNKIILQLHGGAYIRDLYYRENLYQRMAQQYLDITSYEVLTINYRIAPDNPYPAALEDAILAYNYLLDNGFTNQNIIVAGDSAGGGLALALTLYLKDNSLPLPKAVITMSAWTNLDYKRIPSYVGDNDPKNPYISPIYGDYQGFPPLLMQVGTKDITNDTTEVARKAADSNVDVTVTTYQGMVHVFQCLFPKVDSANDAWDEIKEFVNNL